MRIVISGGGICGLTLALAARRAGLTPIVIQQRSNIYSETFGGGIGLWPPSQMVYEQLGILDRLQQISKQMPNPCYMNNKGWKLGQPSINFHSRYKVLCLQRQILSKILYQQCQKLGIEIRTATRVTNAESHQNYVNVQLQNNDILKANILIGADGINSNVRNIIMKERKLAPIQPFHCGYAYFRAVVDLSKDNRAYQKEGWHKIAFQNWGEQKRFGYVPLKQPKTFWFMAIPIKSKGLSEFIGSHTCTEDQKQWILSQISHWKTPVNAQKLIRLTPANTILRTDIRKIKGVTEFPWSSKNNNIILVGDAANATAPNLAQGAGLAIQSAWDLVSMVNFNTGDGLQAYLQRRKKRAETVQLIADLIATIGQISSPYSNIRDTMMASATKLFPKTEQMLFQSAVKYSLGGSSSTPHWLTSLNPHSYYLAKKCYSNNLLAKIIGKQQFEKLPEVTQSFRDSFVGRGYGKVTVETGYFGRIFGLPHSMNNQKFGAYVDVMVQGNNFNIIQKWTRVFGEGSHQAKKYSTIHRGTPNFHSKNTGISLTESVSDSFFGQVLRLGYDIQVKKNLISYKSIGLWLWNYKLPSPKFILPTSQWVEEQTKNGWNFEGIISLPLLFGGFQLMRYRGTFVSQQQNKPNNKTVVIAGGRGLIGSATARQFYLNGWSVTILSRGGQPDQKLPFAKIVKWNPQSLEQKQVQNLSNLLKETTVIINLAGENAGSQRWNDKFKSKILNSRLKSIELISKSIHLSGNTNIKYIQASAVGIYGHRKDDILNDNAGLGPEEQFRVTTLIAIQELTKRCFKNAIIARIGHAFGSKQGLFPVLKLSSQFRAKKFSGTAQYVPWVHVQDLARAFNFMVDHSQSFSGKFINLAAPQHHTYESFYRIMGKINNRRLIFTIPQSMMQLALGELSSVIFQSQRPNPSTLLENGFQFKYGKLEDALLSRELL